MRQGSVAARLRQTASTLTLRRPRSLPHQRRLPLTIQWTAITFGASWLLIVPVCLWAIATGYVPIMAPALRPIEAWSIALVILLLTGVSLISHVLAHLWVAHLMGSEVPSRIPVYLCGDAAQVWPAARTPQCETLIAMAGPAVNLLFAGLTYLLWDIQLHVYLNVSMLFLAAVNLGLAMLNLAPGFPFDGGRLARTIVWSLLQRPDIGTRLGLWSGGLLLSTLATWGITVLLQQVRFSLVTGASILCVAMLHLLALWRQPAWHWELPALPGLRHSALRGLLASLLLLSLLGLAVSLVPTTHGLRAPGDAVAIEPMVTIDPAYRYPTAGGFLLTTVVEQTPILAGQWLYGQVSPVADIMRAEQVVPPGITPQQVMQHNYRLLEHSQSTAVVVALRLAGYAVPLQEEVVEVVSILEESSAQGVLQPGDQLLRLNGESIQNVDHLFAQIREQDPGTPIELEVERAGERRRLAFSPTPPVEPGNPPWLGMTVQTVRLEADLPFAVAIRPHKIVGGSSAGLMFTLAVYNLITPEDLTGGRWIAGTGTINLDGVVGPIGGIKQKVAAAEAAGAEYFLVPPANYEEARRVERRIKVVEVATVKQAIDFLRSLPPVKDRQFLDSSQHVRA